MRATVTDAQYTDNKMTVYAALRAIQARSAAPQNAWTVSGLQCRYGAQVYHEQRRIGTFLLPTGLPCLRL